VVIKEYLKISKPMDIGFIEIIRHEEVIKDNKIRVVKIIYKCGG
jgi:hypothetical protein